MAKKPRHPSLERLFDFVKDQGVVGPSALAAAMGESEQVVTNWGARGMSNAGAIAAEKRFGCSAVWLLEGVNPPTGATAAKGMSLDHMFNRLPDDELLRAKVHHAAMAHILDALSGIDAPSDARDQSVTPRKSTASHP